MFLKKVPNIIPELSGYRKKGGYHTIYYTCYFTSRFRKLARSGIDVKSMEWDPKTNSVDPKYCDDADRINSILWGKVAEARSWAYAKLAKKEYFTWNDLKHVLEGYSAGFSGSFNDYCRHELKKYKIRKSTKKDMETTLDILDKFGETHFSDLSPDWVSRLNDYLAAKGYKHNTIAKHHKNIRQFVTKAYDDGVMDEYQRVFTRKVMYKYKRTKEDWLRPEELKSLAEVGGIHVHRFLASCFTGLAHADINKLNPVHHILDYGKGPVIEIKRTKTDKLAVIPVYKLFDGIALYFIKKMASDRFKNYPNNLSNEKLKQAAKKAGLARADKVTFHVARHTFISYIAALTGNVMLVMEYAGITDINTAMRYVQKIGQYVDDIKEFDWSELKM
jgi:integrase